MSSVSILKLSNSQLHMVARDYSSLWPVCVQALEKGCIIGANVSGKTVISISAAYIYIRQT